MAPLGLYLNDENFSTRASGTLLFTHQEIIFYHVWNNKRIQKKLNKLPFINMLQSQTAN